MNRPSDVTAGIGASLARREDAALLTGRGRFVDDLNLTGQVHAWFVRSPYPHARIRGTDLAQARGSRGVVGVFTGADLERDGVGFLHAPCDLRGLDGTLAHNPPRRAMATHAARFVGDTVAMVLARGRDEARDAAERVEVDYEPLEAVVDAVAALEAGAPRVFEDLPSNVALDWEGGDAAAIDATFARAAHIVRVELVQNRVVGGYLEPRGALAEFDPATGRYTVYTPTMGGTLVHLALAEPGLGVPPEKVRVVTPEVGGGFGVKNVIYPEQILVAWAAARVGRPVKWYADRADSFLADYHARDHVMRGELALDAEGRFLAIRSDALSNMGAYLTAPAPIIPTDGGTRMLANVYRIGAVHARARCVYSNTAPITAYRGAGKPEYAHLVERLVDTAARELGRDAAELRRRNLIGADELPYRTPTGMVYDSGDFAANMDAALELAAAGDLGARKAEARSRGKLLGLGISVYTEPDGFKDNRVSVAFDPRGGVTVITSAQSNGQGHVTTFAQIAADLLGVPVDDVDVVEGDTDRTGIASGTGGSRSTTVTGTAIHRCAREIVDKGREIAAHHMEVATADVEFDGGVYRIKGTDRTLPIQSVAAMAFEAATLAPGLDSGLDARCHYDAPAYSYPSGCHVCELEIDRETGGVEVTRYVHASDFGTVVNPLLLEGQLQGGIAQGIGQALYEETVYDRDSGQLLTGSFLDYCLPRASQLPDVRWRRMETRCATNPLGVKGCGESGPTAALPAIMNAVADALADFDTRGLDMPVTAEKVWRVLRGGRSSS